MSQSHSVDRLKSAVAYYQAQSAMSEPRSYAPYFAGLPAGVPQLVSILQGLMLHIFWAERYGVKLSEGRQAEVQIRAVGPKLARLLELEPAPLACARPVEQRLVGNCRDFSLMLTSMLRATGFAARSRCGFGTYFTPGKFEDHWVTEYWDDAQARWVMVDSQLDDLQKQVLGISFDSLDMPAGKFMLAGEAWKLCRSGRADPELFGIFQWHGMDFVRDNLLRDLLALNKFEVLPWDIWGVLAENTTAESTPEQLSLLDDVAERTLAVSGDFSAVRAVYDENPLFHPPQDWAN